MSRVAMPKRRAVSACPSSWSTTMPNTASTNTISGTAVASDPPERYWASPIHTSNSQNVA
jgi:hypothetical protein